MRLMADAGRAEVDAALVDLEKRIKKEYAQAANEVKAKLDRYLAQYAELDSKYRAKVKAGEMSQRDYIRWRRNRIMSTQRWIDMRNVLAQDYSNADEIARKLIGDHMLDVYAMGRNYGAYEIEHGTSLNTSYTLYNHEAVERLIRDDPDLLPMPGEATRKAISEGKLKAWNRKQLQSAMTQSILQGESIPDIAKRLSRTVGTMNRNAAIRTAPTATTEAENAGKVASYKRAQGMGIQLIQEWVATLDGRTRHEHRLLDGQRCPVGGKFSVDGYEIAYPGDPSAPGYLVYNCRCALISVIKGITDDEEMERDSRLGEMSYEEWKVSKPVYGKK